MRRIMLFIIFIIILLSAFLLFTRYTKAESYNGTDIAFAILNDPSTLVNSSYSDTDTSGQFRQRAILQSLGTMFPTDGSNFVLLSTGIAGANPVTTNSEDPGSERGTWFGKKYPGWGDSFDEAKFTMDLKVPPLMHNLSYDLQFFSMEYPDYVGSQYNDKVTVTVNSPSKGTSTYMFDVNSGDFVFKSSDIPGTGFDLFAVKWIWWLHKWVPTSPSGVDTVTTTPHWSDDAGASALVTRVCPVSPNETVTVTFDIRDVGDNQFDSAVFIDNVRFTGYGIPEIKALKTWQDVNGGTVEPGDKIHYTITISNIGNITQPDNPGDEFDDPVPDNTTYVPNSLSSSSGSASYDSNDNKIVWNGVISAESSVKITYDVLINSSLSQTSIVSNQGVVHWDRDGDGTNEETELTDDPSVDDGIDSDGDGETGDDDPTVIIVLIENISELTEDFSDDVPGHSANQNYFGFSWFSTSQSSSNSVFEVAGGYHYSTPNSFKTQLRSTDTPLYWNYSFEWLSGLSSYWWEINFTCGNNSEPSDLILSFKNTSGLEIARLKFDYMPTDSGPPNNYAPMLYYLRPNGQWIQLGSDFRDGFLFSSWYTLRIEQYGNMLNYSLYRIGKGLIEKVTDAGLGATLSRLSSIEWSTTKNPVVAPIFFWDEHRIGFR